MNRRSFLNKTSSLALVAIATPTALLTQIPPSNSIPPGPGLIYYINQAQRNPTNEFQIGKYTTVELIEIIQSIWYDRTPVRERKLVMYI